MQRAATPRGSRETGARSGERALPGGMVLALAAVGLALPASAAATARPELVPSPPKVVAGDAGPDGTVRISTKVVNRGARTARGSLGEIVLSTDARRDDRDVTLQRDVVPALRPRQTRRTTIQVRLPAIAGARRYRVIHCADAADAVVEADEGNNCAASRHLPSPAPNVARDADRPTTVRECGDAELPRSGPADAFTNMWRRSGRGWTGGDGELSVPLPDGRIAWLYADTFVGGIAGDSRAPDTQMISNAIVMQDGACLETAFGGTADNPTALVVPKAGGWYWPASGYVEDGELRVLYYRMERTGSGQFDWRFDGTDLAAFTLPDLRLRDVTQVVAQGNPMWGGAVVDAGTYTYMFGIRGEGLTSRMVVARTARGRLGQAPLEYWAGQGWSPDPVGARPIADDATILSVVADGDGWTLVTQRPMFSEEIIMRRAPAPEGPWSDARVIARATAPPGGYTYGGAIHPEFGGGKDDMLLSYSVNGWDSNDILAQPDLYRPRFVRVSLE